MKTLFINGKVVNVFTSECTHGDVLVENGKIIGVGDYKDEPADEIVDLSGKVICPGFIDGHIHIESSMLTPAEFARVAVAHGTTAVVADPHEIANVCGVDGIKYMLEASENLPLDMYFMLPSCVPATPFDEAGAVLKSADLKALYSHERVLGLGEVMSYPLVLAGESDVLQKIADAKALGCPVNGHAPLLSGHDLDKYISAGIYDDHECSSAEEAKERIRKGQRVMVRQGTAARNLIGLLPLFDEPWASRCLLVTDDKHPKDLLENGHIDDIIRQAAAQGKDPITAIKMATIVAADHFGLTGKGAIAPGYSADMVILDDLGALSVCGVYKNGALVAEEGKALPFVRAEVSEELKRVVAGSFHMDSLSPDDFKIDAEGQKECRVIGLVENQLLTEEKILTLDFDDKNGVDVTRDIVKLAVCERHSHTGHKGVGFIQGIGLKCGAIAASVSHDSHNLIIIGTNDEDMAVAGNRIVSLGGGSVVVKDGAVIGEMPLPIGGVMTDVSAETAAEQNEAVRRSVHTLGVPQGREPFMTMAFVSLPVIPHIKMTTLGLVDVDKQELAGLFA